MEKLDIDSIKDAVYEFEGLLELADLREDKHSALLPLMKKKLEIINALFPDNLDTLIDVADEEVESDEEGYSIDDEPEEITETASSEEEEEIRPENPEEKGTDVEEDAVKEETEEKAEEVAATLAEPRGPKPAFCINDRFRFRRELFGNSDKDFESAMNLVVMMDNYEEAEDYFLGSLGWDINKPEVADFMAIMQSYFEK